MWTLIQKGERLEAVSANIFQSQPPALALARTGVPADLEHLVNRTLVKTVAQRYQTVIDLLGELRTVQTSPTMETATQTDVPSIAVLPFANMSADPEQEYFCDGLAEELIDALARLEGLRVVGRTSSFQFRGKGHDLRAIGEQLGAKTVLERSVRKAGNRLRINAQLISANDGYHLWSERYDRDMDDVFAVQDDIARTVVKKLKVKLLGAADTPLVTRPTDNVEAYNLVLQGRHHALRTTRAAFERALAYFSQALSLEPTYAQAHAGIARVHTLRAVMSLVAPHVAMPEAKEVALKALALDETEAEAHLALAYVLHWYEWDWAGAEREYRRALTLSPGDTHARCSYASLLRMIGRVDESVAESRSAMERDPVSNVSRYNLAVVFATARRFEEAIAEANAGIELDPSYHLMYQPLALGLAGLDRRDEAVEAYRLQVNAAPADPVPQACLGWALGFAGQREEALTILGELERRRRESFLSGALLAWVCLGLGDHDQAISWLQQAAEERDCQMPILNTLFVYDPLRSDPRFQALLKKMNFPPASPK